MVLPVADSSQPNILLVDDDPDIGRGLQDWLEHCRFRVEWVGTGTDALARTTSTSFTTIILDLGLPDMDGVRVLEAVRRIDSQLPVIILTALVGEDVRKRCIQHGAHGFVSKPYNKQELLKVVRSAVALRQAALKTNHAEQALRCEEYAEQQRRLDLIPGFFWYKDRDNRIIRANARAAESIGRTVREVEGQSTYDLYPEAEQYYRDDQEVLMSGRPKLGIVELYQMGSGEKRWVHTDKVPYRDSSGAIVGVLVFASDLSDDIPQAPTSIKECSTERTSSGPRPLRLISFFLWLRPAVRLVVEPYRLK